MQHTAIAQRAADPQIAANVARLEALGCTVRRNGECWEVTHERWRRRVLTSDLRLINSHDIEPLAN